MLGYIHSQSRASHVLLVILALLPCVCSVEVDIGYSVKVKPFNESGIWEGWGSSLSWWAKAVGGSDYEDTYADLLFSQKQDIQFGNSSLPGLGFNIARYNTGGCGKSVDGDKTPASMLWYKRIFSFMPTSANNWNFNLDQNQVSMLQAAKRRTEERILVEFYSRSPVWWMTKAKAAGGAIEQWQLMNFASYLATVVHEAETAWGIKVDYIAPFYEPLLEWVSAPLTEERSIIKYNYQEYILAYLRQELDSRSHQWTGISASDDNTMQEAALTLAHAKTQWRTVRQNTRNSAGVREKVNVHGMSGRAPCRDDVNRGYLRQIAGNKKIWQSDYGDSDPKGIELARSILADFSFLRPSAWLYGQPVESGSPWGLLNGHFGEAPSDETSPLRGKPLSVNTKYYVMAQFSRFIRPGYSILKQSDEQSVVALDAKRERLAIITVSGPISRKVTYDLSEFPMLDSLTAHVTETRTNGELLFSNFTVPIIHKKVTIKTKPYTVYSTVVEKIDRGRILSRYVKFEVVSQQGGTDSAAVCDLELRDHNDDLIPNSAWSISADINDGYRVPSNAIDRKSNGNPKFGTCWRTPRTTSTGVHHIIIDLMLEKSVGGFKYRGTQYAGSAVKYNLYGSTDLKTWVTLSRGILPEESMTEQVHVFPLTPQKQVSPDILLTSPPSLTPYNPQPVAYSPEPVPSSPEPAAPGTPIVSFVTPSDVPVLPSPSF